MRRLAMRIDIGGGKLRDNLETCDGVGFQEPIGVILAEIPTSGG